MLFGGKTRIFRNTNIDDIIYHSSNNTRLSKVKTKFGREVQPGTKKIIQNGSFINRNRL
jgi:hypothetical protein